MESSLVKEYKEKLTNEFIKALEEKGLNWKKDWIDNYKICENAYGKGYKSFLNNIILSKFMEEHKYYDNRFFTFKQAEKLGYKVKKGEKSVAILEKIPKLSDKNDKLRSVTWQQFYNRELLDKNIFDINNIKYETITQQICFLFNAHQLDGIELRQNNENYNNEKVNDSYAVRVISEEMGVPIINREQDSLFDKGAYYRQEEDKIYLPNVERFKSSWGYNAPCLHELAHATGHETRLNRETLKDYHKDIKIRAQEELVAEVTSAYMGIHIKNIDKITEEDDITNHKAYIKNWSEVLKENKNLIFEAFKNAEKATEFLTNVLEQGIMKRQVNAQEQIM